MLETQPGRMQEMPPWRQPHCSPHPAPAVRLVANDRVTHRGQVHTDLMRPSGEQPGPQQVDRVEPRQSHEIRPRDSPGTDDRHPLSVSRITSNGTIDREPISTQVAPREHCIDPANPSLGERRRQAAMHRFRLGDQQEAGGVLVQSMHESGAG